MRVRADRLRDHLSTQLLPLYVVSGEEPLQREECVDALRAAARAQQFDERTVFHVDRRFDWRELQQFGDTLSLFASRRIVELRLAAKLDGAARAAVTDYAARPPADVLAILVLPFRVDGNMGRSKWFTALEKAGAHIAVWPIDSAHMPQWVKTRARAAKLRLSDPAAALLAERGEGNLLACAQEIDKLALLHAGTVVDVDEVVAATADSARYDAFDLVDACFRGDAGRTLRILRVLNEEGARIPEVLGALAWAMRAAADICARTHGGIPLEQALGPQHGAWRVPQRREALEAALARHGPTRWPQLLARAARVDRRAKGHTGRLNVGIRRGIMEAWAELESLGLDLCGVSLAAAPRRQAPPRR